MPVHPDLADAADLLGVSVREAGEFCAEVAWHVSDRQITYAMIVAELERHPRVDPTPELVAAWIMATPPDPEAGELEDYVELEYNPGKWKLNRIQRHDFRDAQAALKKCPHGVPITQRCRICRPQD